MTGRELMMGMSFVEERFVAEADSQTISKSENRAWIKWASLAACLCILLLGVRGLDRTEAPATAAGAPTAQPQEAGTGDGKDVCQVPMAPAGEPGAPAMGSNIATVRIEEWTGTDFTGTVISGETLAAGTKVTVVLEPSEEMRGGEYPAGSIVEMQVTAFDDETNTLFTNAITLVEE